MYSPKTNIINEKNKTLLTLKSMHKCLIRLLNRGVNTSGRAGGQPSDDPTQSRAHSEPRAGTRGRVDELTVRAATFRIDRTIRRCPSLDPTCLLNTFPPLNVVKQCHTQRAGAGAPWSVYGARIILKQNISPLGSASKSLCHRCGSSHTVDALKGAVSDGPPYQNQVSGMRTQFLA